MFAELSEELVCAGDGVVVFFSELSEKLACGGGVGCSEGGGMLEDCWHAAVARHAPVLNKEYSIRRFGRKPKPFQPRRNSSCLRTFQTHTKHPFRSNSLHRQKMTCTSPFRGPDESRLPRTICDIDTPYSFCYMFRTHLHIARSHTLRDFHREDRIQWHRRFRSSG